jgi:hypothetical protein
VIRYTTPTDELVVKGVDLTGYEVWASYRQRSRKLDVQAADVTYDGTDTTVLVPLTQEQTGSFCCGQVSIQVNWLTPEGARDATTIKEVSVGGNLLDRVMEYGD